MTGPDHIPAVILAGGASQRMGTDKAMLAFGDGTLLSHALARIGAQSGEVVVSRHDGAMAEFGGAPVIADGGGDHHGPLSGILAALRHFEGSAASHIASIAVDTPFFPADFVGRLQAAAPRSREIIAARSNGRVHPVFALWPVLLADDLADWLADGNRRLMAFVERHPHRYVDFDVVGASDPFFNVNTPEDLEEARKRLGSF
ncbi:molybdenum cofactor guanylyltransferase MobA [Martelella soudanensis]|uniref:molybdenum cofactor guanylyltransferase MobA n=1 Tax=unclassified Martelella TaxID=2629616 RepID=UPI0015DEFA6C|nr:MULTISPECIES: molybdenum cofactor guanylyltransferase MobA [unclassified Martelella]